MAFTPERLYLDSCVLNRPADDQRQPRISAETVAIAAVLDLSVAGEIHWITSSAVATELTRNPDPLHRADALLLLSLAGEFVRPVRATFQRAISLRTTGYGDFDALHLALAEQSGANVFLTVDDRLIRRAARQPGHPTCNVENPIDWIRRRQPWLLKP